MFGNKNGLLINDAIVVNFPFILCPCKISPLHTFPLFDYLQSYPLMFHLSSLTLILISMITQIEFTQKHICSTCVMRYNKMTSTSPFIFNQIMSLCPKSHLFYTGIQLHSMAIKLVFISNVYISRTC